MQGLRVSSGDKLAAAKWVLPPDGAKVMFMTAEVEFSRKLVTKGPAVELDGLFLMQHLTSRFATQVSSQISAWHGRFSCLEKYVWHKAWFEKFCRSTITTGGQYITVICAPSSFALH